MRLTRLILLFGVLGTSGAHENAEFHLAGMTLCVDPGSVLVELDVPSEDRRRAAQAALERSLTEVLETTFARTAIDADVVASCAGSEAYTLLNADVRYLDPETYIGFGNEPYTYSLFLQVGRHIEVAALRAAGGLPDNQYNAFVSEIYPEGDEGQPFEQFVPEQAAPLVGQLASYWWEDNPPGSRWSRLLPPLAGGVLALLTAFVLYHLLKGRSKTAVAPPNRRP